jgi:hypothetical protein
VSLPHLLSYVRSRQVSWPLCVNQTACNTSCRTKATHHAFPVFRCTIVGGNLSPASQPLLTGSTSEARKRGNTQRLRSRSRVPTTPFESRNVFVHDRSALCITRAKLIQKLIPASLELCEAVSRAHPCRAEVAFAYTSY